MHSSGVTVATTHLIIELLSSNSFTPFITSFTTSYLGWRSNCSQVEKRKPNSNSKTASTFPSIECEYCSILNGHLFGCTQNNNTNSSDNNGSVCSLPRNLWKIFWHTKNWTCVCLYTQYAHTYANTYEWHENEEWVWVWVCVSDTEYTQHIPLNQSERRKRTLTIGGCAWCCVFAPKHTHTHTHAYATHVVCRVCVLCIL